MIKYFNSFLVLLALFSSAALASGINQAAVEKNTINLEAEKINKSPDTSNEVQIMVDNFWVKSHLE